MKIMLLNVHRYFHFECYSPLEPMRWNNIDHELIFVAILTQLRSVWEGWGAVGREIEELMGLDKSGKKGARSNEKS